MTCWNRDVDSTLVVYLSGTNGCYQISCQPHLLLLAAVCKDAWHKQHPTAISTFIAYLTFCLAVFLACFGHLCLTFFLASLLTFFLTFFLAFFLPYLLTLFSGIFLTFCVTLLFLASLLTFSLTFCLIFFASPDILSDSISGTSSDIPWAGWGPIVNTRKWSRLLQVWWRTLGAYDSCCEDKARSRKEKEAMHSHKI